MSTRAAPAGGRGRLGLRSETLAVLPAAALLLGGLAVLVAQAHRMTIEELVAEREREAVVAARALAARATSATTIEDLRRSAPGALGVALLDAHGNELARSGEVAARLDGAQGIVAGTAPLPAPAPVFALGAARLAVAYPAPLLSTRRTQARRLFYWVLAVAAAVLALVVLFVRRLLTPYEHLLERARRIRMPEDGDETAFLVATFERAVQALENAGPAGEAERRAAAESLRRVGEVAAGVAHELRNGLAVVGGYVEILEGRSHGGVWGSGDAADLAEIRAEVEVLERVVNDLLSFARPGAARAERLDAGEIAALVVSDPAFRDFEIQLRRAPTSGKPPVIVADRALVERGLRNLLSNAAEAERRERSRRAPAPIEVSVAAAGGEVRFTVEDRGPGLPPTVRDHLGEPFVTARPGGVGLGLAIVRRVAALHGGGLEIGDREGGGTRATLSLPLAET